MVGVTEEEAELVIKECEDYINRPHCAVFAARRSSDFLKENHELYDPNFTAEPGSATHLTKAVRDTWRIWSGYWMTCLYLAEGTLKLETSSTILTRSRASGPLNGFVVNSATACGPSLS